MSRNLGRKIHHIDQNNTHIKLMNEIADVKSLLETSTQTTKELKTRLNGLAEKKDAGKSPRKIHAPSNRFDTPVPEIQGLSGLIETMSLATTTNNSMSASDWDVASGQPLDDSEMRNDSEVQVNPCEIPSFDFDLDLFNQMLEQEPIPEPTDAELAAHTFLRKVLGK